MTLRYETKNTGNSKQQNFYIAGQSYIDTTCTFKFLFLSQILILWWKGFLPVEQLVRSLFDISQYELYLRNIILRKLKMASKQKTTDV